MIIFKSKAKVKRHRAITQTPGATTVNVSKFGHEIYCRRCLNTQLKYTFGCPCPNDPQTICGMRSGKSKESDV